MFYIHAFLYLLLWMAAMCKIIIVPQIILGMFERVSTHLGCKLF